MRFVFTIHAVPVAQPRQRVGVVRGHARAYLPSKHPVNAYKAACAIAASQHGPGVILEGPIALRAVFVLPRPVATRPKNGPRIRHARKPDADNLAKSTFDALNGLVWRDDSQLAVVTLEKWVAAADEIPHVEIEISAVAG